eukprot:CFRG0320T1
MSHRALLLIVVTILFLVQCVAGQFFQFETGFDDVDEDEHDSKNMYKKDLDPECVYYCEEADVCVELPHLCPCPNVHSKRCQVNDWYVCLEPGADQILKLC